MTRRQPQDLPVKIEGENVDGEPVYVMPDDATPDEICNWMQWVGMCGGDENDVRLPCVVEVLVGYEYTEHLRIRDVEEAQLVMNVIGAVTHAAERQAEAVVDKWIRRTWDALGRAQAAAKAIAECNLPTVEETDEWWTEIREELPNRFTPLQKSEQQRRKIRGET